MRGNDKLSFSAQVREELVRLPAGKSCCMLSELSALTRTSGHLSFRGGGRLGVTYRVDNAGVARRIFQLLKKQLNISPTLHFTQSSRLGGRRTCVLTLSDMDTQTLLTALHMAETDETGMMHLKRTMPRHPLTRQCCRRAFLRGAFLGAGTVTDPEKDWHFEWSSENEELPNMLSRLLEKCDLPFRTYERKGRHVVYLKGAQHITDMLVLMGAAQSVLDLENIRIEKQVRAHAVRMANCDEHNSERMLDASAKQMKAIRTILLKEGLFTLPPALQELARLRLEHSELSLQELGQLMDPPVGKSAINNRMRRLMAAADEIEQREENGT
ncbi:MAG: DNA-binding protein WhiA [Clostridia bacterium]|nr:DNA-binding protein WhiA [Clostridia bacterium]